MARYKLIIAYDGSGFSGMQRQGINRTVQLALEAALHCLAWQGSSIAAAGRTDAGVHAEGQVVSFDLDWRHTPEDLARALNAHLPLDVAVKSAMLAGDDFHPRFNACCRTYRYTIYCQPERHPLRERFAWRVWPPANWDALAEAADLLKGRHDFAAFGRPHRPEGSTVREMYEARWQREAEGDLCFEVQGNAFLYHQVRRMVWLQVAVGQSRLNLKDLADALSGGKSPLPGMAPAQGLVLTRVGYGHENHRFRPVDEPLE